MVIEERKMRMLLMLNGNSWISEMNVYTQVSITLIATGFKGHVEGERVITLLHIHMK